MDIQTIDKEIKRLKELKKSIIAQNKLADEANKKKLSNWQKGLKEKRIECAFSLNEVAEFVGVKKQSIHKWENNLQPIPLERAKQIAFMYAYKL